LRNGQGWAVSHDEKVTVIQDHFQNIMRRTPQRHTDLNWERLQILQHNLDFLVGDFMESEVKNAIDHMPSDKAPGPDGFTSLFFKECWEIVKEDVMNASNTFHRLRTSSLSILNIANVVLIAKKDGAESVLDYRPISLLHSSVKII
jgi:hypothetical protein